MSEVYEPEAIELGNITIPNDGDSMMAASVNVPFEALADGVRYATDYGPARLDPLADLAALAAITTPADGLIRTVKDHGAYRFDAASIMSATGALVIAAGDATPGKWLWSGLDLVGAASGVAGLNSSAQLVVVTGGYPTFDSARSLVRSVPLQNFAITAGNVTRAKTAAFAPFGGANFLADASNAQIVSGAFNFLNAPSSSQSAGIQLCLDPFIVDGSTLSSIVIQVQAAAAHAGLTLTQVSAGVFRKAIYGTTLSSLRSAGDFATDAQGSTGAYQASHSLSLSPDQSNVVDKSAYNYFLQVWDEFGTHALPGMGIQGIGVTSNLIADMRFP